MELFSIRIQRTFQLVSTLHVQVLKNYSYTEKFFGISLFWVFMCIFAT